MTSRKRKWRPKQDEIKVKPVTSKFLYNLAGLLRKELGDSVPVNVEAALNKLSSANLLSYEVLEDSDLPDIYAITNGRHIRFSESVISAIGDVNDPLHTRHRFTTAHEIGHALLHNYITVEGLSHHPSLMKGQNGKQMALLGIYWFQMK